MTSKTITLTEPVKRGEETIASVTIARPDVGALRGTKLTDLMQMDVNVMLKLLPRITRPALLPAEVAALAPADFLELAGTVVSFFVSAEQMAEMERQSP